MNRFLLALLLPSATAAAQFTQYVAPATSGVDGAVDCGFFDAIEPPGVGSTQVHRDLEAPPFMGSPVEVQWTNATLRCRDDAGGALTGIQRDVVQVVHPGDNGVGSSAGLVARPDMLELVFTPPVGHFGAHVRELESLKTDPGYLRAYDVNNVMIFAAPIRYPNNSDGDNGEVHFLGLVSTQAIIKKVTVTVGNKAGEPDDGENSQDLEFLDLHYGTATALTGRLTTTFANDSGGGQGGTVYFELQCTAPSGVTIHALDVNVAAGAGPTGSIDVYVRQGDFGWAGPLASGTATVAGPGLPTHVALTPSLQLGPGCTLDVALVATGMAHRYTLGDGVLPTVYANPALTLTAGQASNQPLVPPWFSPRIPNVRLYHSPGGACPSLGSVWTVGQGYAVQATSFFESMSPAQFDLGGGGLVFAPSPTDDSVLFRFVPTVAMLPFSTLPSQRLLLGADDQSAVSTLSGTVLPLVVGANGWVALAGGNSNAGPPSAATMLGNPVDAFYSWKDLDPSAVGGGRVYYEEQGYGPIRRGLVTFDGVYGQGTNAANSLQFVCDFVVTTTGYELLQVEIVWGTMAASGTDVLVGWSPGGASVTPPPRDLSAVLSPTQTDAVDRTVTLEPVGRPVQGGAPGAFAVFTDELPVPGLFHLGLVGLFNPNSPLDFLGMHGCTLYSTLDSLAGSTLIAGSGVTWTALTLPPASVSFVGVEFYLQSAILFTDANDAFGIGAVTSNGLRCRVGSL